MDLKSKVFFNLTFMEEKMGNSLKTSRWRIISKARQKNDKTGKSDIFSATLKLKTSVWLRKQSEIYKPNTEKDNTNTCRGDLPFGPIGQKWVRWPTTAHLQELREDPPPFLGHCLTHTSHLNQIRTLLTRKKEGNVGWVSDRQYLPNTVHKQVTEEQIRLTNKPMKSSGLHWSSENYNLMVGGGREEERDREREYHTTIRLKKF